MSKDKNVKFYIKRIKINYEKRNIDSYKSMSSNQLINLISPTSRWAFKIEGYIAKILKIELKCFIYHNYGYLSPKTKDEVYQVLNRHTVNSF